MPFTVAGGTPPPASLISPSGTICTTNPTYIWNAGCSATWYYLWVNDASGSPKISQWYLNYAWKRRLSDPPDRVPARG
jgi:hypothetical protein